MLTCRGAFEDGGEFPFRQGVDITGVGKNSKFDAVVENQIVRISNHLTHGDRDRCEVDARYFGVHFVQGGEKFVLPFETSEPVF